MNVPVKCGSFNLPKLCCHEEVSVRIQEAVQEVACFQCGKDLVVLFTSPPSNIKTKDCFSLQEKKVNGMN